MRWNFNGSLLATTHKDKKMRIIDPRSSKIVAENKIHGGVKASKVEWIGSSSATDENYKIISTGFSSQATREIAIWDLRKFGGEGEDKEAEPLNLLELDQ